MNNTQRWLTLRQLLIRARNRLGDWYYWPESNRKLQDGLAHTQTPSAAVDFIYAYRGAGFYKWLIPNQDKHELSQLAARINQLAPKVIVEIGTRDGGTLLVWSQINPLLDLLVSVDLPGGIHGGGYPTARIKFYQAFVANRPKTQLALLQCDSQTETTKATLATILANRPIDFLFIDGDHRYPGVKRDYELYAPLVRPEGLIGFHDIRPNQKDASIQVYQLWDEIKAQHPNQIEEIVHEPYQGRYGIGLLTKS